MCGDSCTNPSDDVHVSVFLHGLRMDFAACVTAAMTFAREWRHAHYPDAVEVLPNGAEGLPRLPCERLYCEGLSRHHGRTADGPISGDG